VFNLSSFYVASVHLDISKVDRDVRHVATVFQMYVPNISSVFIRMLQIFHLNIAKVHLVLHMFQWDPPVAVTCLQLLGPVHACGSGGGTSSKRGNRAGAP
jgi:hypothetical protein